MGRVRLARKAVDAAQMKMNTCEPFPLPPLSRSFSSHGPVQLRNFQMEKAVSYKIVRDARKVVCEEETAIELDGDTPQRVVSADGYDMIYRLPGACRGKSLVRFYFVIPPLCLSVHHRTTCQASAFIGVTWRTSRRPRPTTTRVATRHPTMV